MILLLYSADVLKSKCLKHWNKILFKPIITIIMFCRWKKYTWTPPIDTDAQSDQGLLCPKAESLDTLEYLNGEQMPACAWWCEYAHFAHVRRHIFTWPGPLAIFHLPIFVILPTLLDLYFLHLYRRISAYKLYLVRRIPSRKHAYIMLTPLKPHFYIVKLGFTGVYIIFRISAQKHRLWVLVRTASPRRF